MQATPTWSLAPELVDALTRGSTAEGWIGDRRPVCSYALISENKQHGAGVQQRKNSAAATPLGLVAVAHHFGQPPQRSQPRTPAAGLSAHDPRPESTPDARGRLLRKRAELSGSSTL